MIELNPQQMAFKEAFLHPKSPSFGNKKQSAIKAGYSKEYAENIGRSSTDWLSAIVRDFERLQKAEKVLDETLEMPTQTLKMDGDTEVVITDPRLISIKTDVAKFVAKGMAKEKYSERKELTGADGSSLFKTDPDVKEQVEQALNDIIK